jgi:hypothetical protein
MSGSGRLFLILAVSYAVALLQVWLWAPLDASWLPVSLTRELLSLGLAVGWLVIVAIAIWKFGRYGMLALPGAAPALLPALAIVAIYAACAFENNCL